MARETIFHDQTPMSESACCKSAQSVEEVRKNYQSMAWMNATDLQPTDMMERPRFGKKG